LLSGMFYIKAQVGINTQNTQGVFHMDAAGDNAVSGTITAAQSTNDILIDNTGNVGIGTLNPTARLHLKSSVAGEAFRLADGTQGENKILLGDADGNVWWGITKGMGGYILNLAQGTYTFSNGTALIFPLNSTGNAIAISNDASYAFMLRCNLMLMKTGMLQTDNSTQRSRQVNVRYELVRSRTGVADVVCQTVDTKPFMQIFDYTTLYVSLIATNILKNDSLYIRITFLGNADADSSALYMLLDYNNPYSSYNTEAFNMGSVIFYQL
ncbi:hypothetical protein, partial [Dysgonomonas macrotermitis]|uniref:hypothetical protein n=1 Tax=Dysgonomonas macrotermitis TaxID=1346286 RepID=UPI001C86F244